MRRCLVVGFAVVWLAAAVVAADKSADIAKTAVEQVLRMQQDAWNRHDLEAFMTGYWNSPELTFFSGARETSGWQGVSGRGEGDG